jgi:AraC-like DNA-binding protein
MLHLATDDDVEQERPARLREFFERLGIRYDAKAMTGDPIEVGVTLQGLPGLQIISGRLQGARFRRIRENNDPTEDVALIVNPSGVHYLAQRGREIVLGDGEAALVTLTDNLESAHRPPGGLFVLRVPSLALAPRVSGLTDCALRRIPRDNPALKLLTEYTNITRQDEIHADSGLQPIIVSHFYDLMAVAVGATRDAAELAQGNGLRAARLHAMKQDIARNLDQGDLSVAAIALRHGCTPRYVQRLFEQEGTSFTDYVLTQRLARAHSLLTDARRADDKISTIALDAGFGDLSYFNRTFRQRYGDTPSAIRMLARRAGRPA